MMLVEHVGREHGISLTGLYYCIYIALLLLPRRRSAPGYALSLPSIARSVVTNSVAESIAVDPYITLLFCPVPAAPPALVLFAHSCKLPYSL